MHLRRPREPRRLIALKARLQDGQRQSDVQIANVSSRGLMAKCAAPPARGARVEIRHGGICIAGTVIWSKGRRFGLHSDAAIDLAALVPAQPTRRLATYAGRRLGGPASAAKPAPPPRKPKLRRIARSGAQASMRDPIIAAVVATVATIAVETGLLDLSAAWDVVSRVLPTGLG